MKDTRECNRGENSHPLYPFPLLLDQNEKLSQVPSNLPSFLIGTLPLFSSSPPTVTEGQTHPRPHRLSTANFTYITQTSGNPSRATICIPPPGTVFFPPPLVRSASLSLVLGSLEIVASYPTMCRPGAPDPLDLARPPFLSPSTLSPNCTRTIPLFSFHD